MRAPASCRTKVSRNGEQWFESVSIELIAASSITETREDRRSEDTERGRGTDDTYPFGASSGRDLRLAAPRKFSTSENSHTARQEIKQSSALSARQNKES